MGAVQDGDRGAGEGYPALGNFIRPPGGTGDIRLTAEQRSVYCVDRGNGSAIRIQRLGFGGGREFLLNLGLGHAGLGVPDHTIRVNRTTKVGQVGLFEKSFGDSHV